MSGDETRNRPTTPAQLRTPCRLRARLGGPLVALAATLAATPLVAQVAIPAPTTRPDAVPRPGPALETPAASVMLEEPPAYDPENDPLRPPREPAPPVVSLRIMLLDLRQILPSQSRGPDASQTAFRHTFGSRRYTPPEQQRLNFDPATVDADIVLMPEVVSFRLARKLFPSRGFRVIRARTREETSQAYSTAQLDGGGPAIAVRLQRGVRIAGIDPVVSDADIATTRLIVGGSSYWLGVCDGRAKATSAAPLPPGASTPPSAAPAADPPCPALLRWAERHRRNGAAAVIAGALSASGSGTAQTEPTGAKSLSIDTDAATSRPIEGSQKIAPRAMARAVVVSGEGPECANTERADRLMIFPAEPVDAPYRMLAWQLPFAASADGNQSGAGGDAKPADAGNRSCSLIAQIAP